MQEKKQDARVRYTKMVIRSALMALLSEKPIAKITVTEICALAGINRATFYSHYQDPTDLLRCIELEMVEDVMSRLGAAFNDSDSGLRSALVSILEYIEKNADICSILLSDSGDTSFQSRVVDILETQFVAPWSDARRLRLEDAEYIYTFCAIGAFGLIRKWLGDGMKKSAGEMAELILRLTDGIYD